MEICYKRIVRLGFYKYMKVNVEENTYLYWNSMNFEWNSGAYKTWSRKIEFMKSLNTECVDIKYEKLPQEIKIVECRLENERKAEMINFQEGDKVIVGNQDEQGMCDPLKWNIDFRGKKGVIKSIDHYNKDRGDDIHVNLDGAGEFEGAAIFYPSELTIDLSSECVPSKESEITDDVNETDTPEKKEEFGYVNTSVGICKVKILSRGERVMDNECCILYEPKGKMVIVPASDVFNSSKTLIRNKWDK